MRPKLCQNSFSASSATFVSFVIIHSYGAMPLPLLALPLPTEREKSQWYFQRFVAHLPSAGHTQYTLLRRNVVIVILHHCQYGVE